jgi:Cu/Ag efflux pump CusA
LGKLGNTPRSQTLDRFFGVTGTGSEMMQWIIVPMVGTMLSSTVATLIVMRRFTHRYRISHFEFL